MVKTCKCKNAYQDKIYGEGKRVFNKTTKKAGERTIYRCTVCGAEK